MESTIYYTCSTIAQVLAAIVGLLGGFAMFRFQTNYQVLIKIATEFLEKFILSHDQNDAFIKLRHRFKLAIDHRRLNLLIREMNTIIHFLVKESGYHNEDNYITELRLIETNFCSQLRVFKYETKDLSNILITGFTTIVFSLIMLVIAKNIGEAFGYVLLGILIFLTTICLSFVFSFVINNISEPVRIFHRLNFYLRKLLRVIKIKRLHTK
jgi:hypothetical protein